MSLFQMAAGPSLLMNVAQGLAGGSGGAGAGLSSAGAGIATALATKKKPSFFKKGGGFWDIVGAVGDTMAQRPIHQNGMERWHEEQQAREQEERRARQAQPLPRPITVFGQDFGRA